MNTFYTDIGTSIYNSLRGEPEKWKKVFNYRWETRVLENNDIQVQIYYQPWIGYNVVFYIQERHVDNSVKPYYPDYINKADVTRIVKEARKVVDKIERGITDEDRKKVLKKHNVYVEKVLTFDSNAISLAKAVLAGDKEAARALIDCCLEQM